MGDNQLVEQRFSLESATSRIRSQLASRLQAEIPNVKVQQSDEVLKLKPEFVVHSNSFLAQDAEGHDITESDMVSETTRKTAHLLTEEIGRNKEGKPRNILLDREIGTYLIPQEDDNFYSNDTPLVQTLLAHDRIASLVGIRKNPSGFSLDSAPQKGVPHGIAAAVAMATASRTLRLADTMAVAEAQQTDAAFVAAQRPMLEADVARENEKKEKQRIVLDRANKASAEAATRYREAHATKEKLDRSVSLISTDFYSGCKKGADNTLREASEVQLKAGLTFFTETKSGPFGMVKKVNPRIEDPSSIINGAVETALSKSTWKSDSLTQLEFTKSATVIIETASREVSSSNVFKSQEPTILFQDAISLIGLTHPALLPELRLQSDLFNRYAKENKESAKQIAMRFYGRAAALAIVEIGLDDTTTTQNKPFLEIRSGFPEKVARMLRNREVYIAAIQKEGEVTIETQHKRQEEQNASLVLSSTQAELERKQRELDALTIDEQKRINHIRSQILAQLLQPQKGTAYPKVEVADIENKLTLYGNDWSGLSEIVMRSDLVSGAVICALQGLPHCMAAGEKRAGVLEQMGDNSNRWKNVETPRGMVLPDYLPDLIGGLLQDNPTPELAAKLTTDYIRCFPIDPALLKFGGYAQNEVTENKRSQSSGYGEDVVRAISKGAGVYALPAGLLPADLNLLRKAHWEGEKATKELGEALSRLFPAISEVTRQTGLGRNCYIVSHSRLTDPGAARDYAPTTMHPLTGAERTQWDPQDTILNLRFFGLNTPFTPLSLGDSIPERLLVENPLYVVGPVNN